MGSADFRLIVTSDPIFVTKNISFLPFASIAMTLQLQWVRATKTVSEIAHLVHAFFTREREHLRAVRVTFFPHTSISSPHAHSLFFGEVGHLSRVRHSCPRRTRTQYRIAH